MRKVTRDKLVTDAKVFGITGISRMNMAALREVLRAHRAASPAGNPLMLAAAASGSFGARRASWHAAVPASLR